ncbi:conserved hypothetical protein [Parafrankia sp. EAN1pec]|uniref:hypothetical protein n=1 Tax=Parafrankia sp. (strain EAN1pec) TaxID=298653 RepID=UPI00005425C3|nr:conserved hypothetical protein [Frankia sp. EAN1pec]
MTRQPRDLPAEKSAIEAATARLLAGMPLRSQSGKLTVTELIVESGLRRDVVYADHPHLVDAFRAFVKAQNSTPTAMRDLADENADLTRKLAATKADLAQERATAATLRRLVVELSLELRQTRDQRLDQANVARITPRDDPRIIGPPEGHPLRPPMPL